MEKRNSLFWARLVTIWILSFGVSSYAAASIIDGLSPAVVQHVKTDTQLSSAAQSQIIKNIQSIILQNQQPAFSQLALQYQSLMKLDSVDFAIKQAVSKGKFSEAKDLLAKQSDKSADHYYAASILNALTSNSRGAYQQIQKALQQSSSNSDYLRQAARLLFMQKKYSQSAYYLQKLVKAEKPSAANIHDIRMLGLAKHHLAEGKSALKYLQQYLTVAKTASSYYQMDANYHLGRLLQDLGNYELAISHYESVTNAGGSYPIVADSYFRLATAWKALGKKDKSVKLLDKSLALDKAIYGVRHPFYAQRLNDTGEVWRTMGDSTKALKQHQQALTIDQSTKAGKRALAKNYTYLGKTMLGKKQYQQAADYFTKALALETEVYGKGHPMLALQYGNIADVWLKKGDSEKALDNFDKALQITRDNYGEKHHEVASLLRSKGVVWKIKGNYKKASEYFAQSLKIEEQVYGKNHPMVTRHMDELGYALNKIGKSKDAQQYHQQALNIDKKTYGTNHANVARDLSHLGSAVDSQGNVQKATELYEKAVEVNYAVRGGSNEVTAKDLDKLGSGLKRLGKLEDSVSTREKALIVEKNVRGKNYKDVPIRENNLGVDYYKLGKEDKAKKYLSEAAKQADNTQSANEAERIRRNLNVLNRNLEIEKKEKEQQQSTR